MNFKAEHFVSWREEAAQKQCKLPPPVVPQERFAACFFVRFQRFTKFLL